MASNRALRVETPEQSKAMLMGVLDGERSAARDIVVFNAGVALYAANVCSNIEAGILKCRDALDSGAAKEKLKAFVAVTQAP
jgi:anthranilate phosphoribosyltransferase